MGPTDTRTLFRGEEPSSEDLAFVNAALDNLIIAERCVLSYDKPLLLQLPDILAEQYGIRTRSDAGRNIDAVVLIDFADRYAGGTKTEIVDLPEALIRCGIDPLRWHYTVSELSEGTASQFDKWTTTNVGSDKGAVLTLQKDLGIGHHAGRDRYDAEREGPLDLYLIAVTTPKRTLIERALRESFWGLHIRWWKAIGKINPDSPSLSVGPRWLTEIRYFRDILGLKKHVGLDLFSDDAELVVAGDMHAMPLPDSAYGFIFIKNTMDKSYDIRQLVREIVRVAAPGGIVIIDQNCGHGRTSPIHRTDVQKADNLYRLFAAQTPTKLLVAQNNDIRKIGSDGSTNNVRLAFKILKHESLVGKSLAVLT
jgi:hypothetical protein